MKKIIRILAVVLVGGTLVSLMIFNSTAQRKIDDPVWDEAAVIGNPEAKNHYIMYTDIMCPYCDVFSRLTMENEEEFQKYLSEHDIKFEVRITDMLYDSANSEHSRYSAEAAYCAAKEDRFWEYYHGAIKALWEDYHSKGIGDSKMSPRIEGMTKEYWSEIGREIGLGDDFQNCYNNEEMLDLVIANTTKAEKVAYGLPYFRFNEFATSGFDTNWGWEYVLQYLDAGLKE